MSLLNSINISNGNSSVQNKSNISASTRRKLESLGIDPTLVSSETQALSLIAARQSEKSFEVYTAQPEQKVEQNSSNNSESSLISEAKSLAEQLGVSISSNDTFEDITAAISSAISDLINRSANDPQALQRAQSYQVQLARLTSQYNDVSTSNTSLYNAMTAQAANARYMLGI